MDRVFLFDVDGTLTRSGQPVDPDFAAFLMTFWPQENVFLVTGSKIEALREQVQAPLLGAASGIFSCLGNEFVRGEEIRDVFRHEFPDELTGYIQKLIDLSPFCWRSGKHISHRTGMLNVSVVGRNANRAEREKYIEFDQISRERLYLVDRINRTFPQYEASLGGQISVDITLKGRNKAQVYKRLRREYPRQTFHFFGDGLEPHGNDYPLASELEAAGVGHQIHHVDGWQSTMGLLRCQYFPPMQTSLTA